MGKFAALFKVSFLGLIHSLGFGGRRNKKRSGGGMAMLVLTVGICLFASTVYSVSMGAVLAQVGAPELVFAIMGMLAVLMCAVFTAIGAREVVFGTRDIDITLALPVSTFSLILARLSALLVETLVLTLALMLPAGVVYIALTGFSLLLLPRLLLGIALLALLPLFLALASGFVLAYISGRFARHALVENLLYFVLLIGVLGGSLFISTGGAGGTEMNAELLYGMFNGWGAPLLWLSGFVAGGSLTALLKLAAISVLPVLVLAGLCSRNYGRVLAALESHGSRNDYKLGRVRSGSPFWALIKKEGARYMNTPIYLFNTSIGLLFLLIAGAAALVMGGQLEEYILQNSGTPVPILPFAAGAVGFMLTMTAITSSSISLEGKTLWVLQSLPIPARQALNAKLAFHQLLAAPFTVIGGAMLALGLGQGLFGVLVLVGGGLLVNWNTALAGLLINLRLPKLDAVNDTVVVKQSAAAGFSLLAGAVLLLIAGVGWWLAGNFAEAAGPLAALVILAACGFAQQAVLRKKGVAMFRQLTE